ncbi:hypothetical protein GCM10010129_24330 [Streptomyces fumigatiscleroticus]|nr:hypothetical protein GCM10010129_24330 [Streptomyces fumigatiscleroticus]
MPAACGAREGTVRVLIVDDEPELTELLSWAVTEAGRQPFLAEDGRSALTPARGCAPHVVVLDGMLPDLDGLQVLRRLRYEHAGLPVLMPTARDALEHRLDGLSAGADDHVTKPFSLEEVMLRLRGLLRRTGAEEAAGEESEVRKYLDDTYVTWSGGTGDDDACYVRVHSPRRPGRGRLPGASAARRRVRRDAGRLPGPEARPLDHPHTQRQRLRQGTPPAALPHLPSPPLTGATGKPAHPCSWAGLRVPVPPAGGPFPHFRDGTPGGAAGPGTAVRAGGEAPSRGHNRTENA